MLRVSFIAPAAALLAGVRSLARPLGGFLLFPTREPAKVGSREPACLACTNCAASARASGSE
jgi:hypothetical protein